MLDELIQQDKALFIMLNNLGTTSWDGFWMFMTNKFSSIPLYLFLAYISFKQFGSKRTLVLVLFVAAMIAAANGLADVFKYGFQRLRPCYDTSINELMRLVKDSCGGKFGYFSAHAGNTMAVATFFSILLKRNIRYIGILLLVWAIMVGYSRIYIGVHFPLDVFTGMVVGLFFGWLFAKLFIFGLTKISL